MDMPAAFIALGALLRDPDQTISAVIETVLWNLGDSHTRERIKDPDGDIRKSWNDALLFMHRAAWPEVAELMKASPADQDLQKRYEEFKATIIKQIKDYWENWLKEHGGK